MRILIGPVEVAGIAKGLSKGLSELGVESQVVLSIKHPFAYGGEKKGFLLAVWQWVGQWRAAPEQPFWRKALAVVLHRAWGFLVLCWALCVFDAFIFLYGRSLTDTVLELRLLKFLRKKTIFIFVGSDIRPPYIDGGFFAGEKSEDLPDSAYVARLCVRHKKRIRAIECAADFIINSPATAHFQERSYINWYNMGIPKEVASDYTPPLPSFGSVRILHSPSNPLAKGTSRIEGVIHSLREKGYSLEFISIKNMPNQKVIDELKRCDFVIDQLYSDSPMAAFAAEAACYGKPAVVGGYFASKVRALGDIVLPPSFFVEPEEIESAVEKLVVDAQYRRFLGEQARSFVAEYWSPRVVAERYLKLINSNPDSQWWVEPDRVFYLEGSGLSRERVKLIVGSLIERCGLKSLQISDKPNLEREFCRLVGISDISNKN